MKKTLFEVIGLSKSYKESKVLKDIHFAVTAGEIVGIVGPNGAGKTTLMECSQGLLPFQEGRVNIFGEDVRHGLSQAARQRIGVAPQFFALPPLLTVQEIVTMYSALYTRTEGADVIIDRVGLRQQARIRFGRLSGGQKRRLALAVALVGQPELLFLDEPTGDLDPQSRRYIWDILLDNAVRSERAVMIATHQMDEVEALCSRVIIIDEGRIREDGSPRALIARHCPQHRLQFEFHTSARPSVEEAFPDVHIIETEATSDTPDLADASLQTEDIDSALHRLLWLKEQRQVDVAHLQISKSSLEDLFIKLTGKALRD